ncbi:hypothetical protein HGRIS_011817 [Hohenbuehelia grisea]|uniref:Uncharacterized protein n=1 Tax=Hohenbuehelia grisea TaxID=104357 RepID=A0ABR3JW92_9AGAR
MTGISIGAASGGSVSEDCAQSGAQNSQSNDVLATPLAAPSPHHAHGSSPPTTPVSPVAPVQVVATSSSTKELFQEPVDDAAQPNKRTVSDPSTLNRADKSAPVYKISFEVLALIFKFALGNVPNGMDLWTTSPSNLAMRGIGPYFWKTFMAVRGTNLYWREVRHGTIRVLPFLDATSFHIVTGLLKSMTGKIQIVDKLNPQGRNKILVFPTPREVMASAFERLTVLNLERLLYLNDHEVVEAYFDHPAPMLESFRLMGAPRLRAKEITQRLFDNTAPALREITLSYCFLPATSPHLVNLTYLSLISLRGTPEQGFYDMLSAAKNLVLLDLYLGLPKIQTQGPRGSLELPRLRHLRIFDRNGFGLITPFFWRLKAPSHLEIEILWDNWDWQNIGGTEADRARAELKTMLEAWRHHTRAGELVPRNGTTTITDFPAIAH